MRTFLIIVIVAHGLIHLLGFVKAFRLAPVGQLAQDISRPAGLFWLLAAALFVIAGILLLARSDSWWIPAVPAVVISQALVIASWGDARFGTVANLVVLLALVPALAALLPGSFSREFEREARAGLSRTGELPPVSEGDLARLPEPVRKYLRTCGTVGRPRLRNLHVTFTGTMHRTPQSGPMKITVEQYEFFDPPMRLFYMKAGVFGVPFDGLHVFRGTNATMRVRVASLFQVVDARGPMMAQSETVTLFNDMCVLAPATLVDGHIQWEPVDSLTARARFTKDGITIGAELRFNEAGELVDFVSRDRFMSADGVHGEIYPWSTPVRDYRDFDGRRVSTFGEAVWHTPRGPFAYARFALKTIEYDCGAK
jgi:hypothetical protein